MKKKSNPSSKKRNFRKKRDTSSFLSKKPNNYKNKPIAEVEGMRLNKYVAHCGICSRRQAADFVKEGLVMVNDAIETNPAYQIQKLDVVRYKGDIIRPETQLVYILMNKPKNCITTLKDEKDRKTVIDVIGNKVKERIFPVGRLDRDTTGLLLLTNDGDLAQKLAHPSHKVEKLYQVSLDKPITTEHLDAIQAGLELEDGKALVNEVSYINGLDKTEVGIAIHIGKNRIVRRIFEHLGYQVKKLDRVYYGGLTKKDLPRGRFRHLTDREIIMLKHFK